MANDNLFNQQNIQSFYAAAQSHDFARQHLFRVTNINTNNQSIQFDTDDYLYITTASLPKRSIKNIKLPYMGLGFNIPGTAEYPGNESWNVTFRMPADLSIREKLEAWTQYIFDDENSTGAYELGALGTLDLALYNKAGNAIRSYKLEGVFCVSLGDYNLDVKSGGDIIEQSATLAYQYWRANPGPASNNFGF